MQPYCQNVGISSQGRKTYASFLLACIIGLKETKSSTHWDHISPASGTPRGQSSQILRTYAYKSGILAVVAMLGFQHNVQKLAFVHKQLGQLHPLLRAHPGAVLVVGNLEMQVGKLIQFWDDIEEVVQHVTWKSMQQHSHLHAMLASGMGYDHTQLAYRI
ncbi:MAG: hypothetical protein FRX49_04356 [Trebouxia sp. A1-2]|nr:MAG: hypothetical protein FRX49_04356 [Trebouxia sp. A1-2]